MLILLGVFEIVSIFYAQSTEMSVQLSQHFSKKLNLQLEIASTSAERELGLSGRASLDDDHGLLFIFDAFDRHGFWMKDMNFPIDIIWLSKTEPGKDSSLNNFKILHIERALSPSTYPKIFTPEEKSDYVLEVNANFAQNHGLHEGDLIQF